jgi:hypothetical protein
LRRSDAGVAPNAIELHPSLAFRCLSGASTGASAARRQLALAGVRARRGFVLLTSRPQSGPGRTASVTVAASPAQTCSITVNYKSGPSQAAGLYPQRGTRITWTWTVGTTRHQGDGQSPFPAAAAAR